MKKIFVILAACVVAIGCYKSDLTNTTHPSQGKVEMVITLPDSELDEDATIPESYTVILGGEEFTVIEGSGESLSKILDPGIYIVYVYSNTSEMNIESNVTESGEGTIISSKIVDGGVVNSLTEDLYFGKQTITVLADEIIYSEIVLNQITRTIKFNLNLAEGNIEDIVGITASLYGIAGQWECVADIPIGDAVTINPAFVQTESLTKAEANDYLTSSIKVLGINGDNQVLNLELTFSNGNTQSIISDVSDQLAGSNDTKPIPITLSASLKVNSEFGVTGTITDWEVYEGEYYFDANQPN